MCKSAMVVSLRTEDATPDQGTDGTEDDAELVHAGF
jgi:hypothetical protein